GSSSLSTPAEKVLRCLRNHGASFFADLVRDSGLLRAQAEQALGELVAQGLATSDGFGGLRALLVPGNRRENPRRRGGALHTMESAGRWNVLPRTATVGGEVEHVAQALLRRWGVVCRRILDRESA